MNQADYPRCKTCKWWGEREILRPGEDHTFVDFEVRECECPVVYGVELWESPYRQDGIASERVEDEHGCLTDHIKVSPNSAFTRDGSGYLSSLHTGPDFGCVHWEAKEQI